MFAIDTEIFVSGGWCRFSKLDASQELLTPAGLQFPSRIFEDDYDGELISLSTDYAELLVTPEHQLEHEGALQPVGDLFGAAGALTIVGTEERIKFSAAAWGRQKYKGRVLGVIVPGDVVASRRNDFRGLWSASQKCVA